MGDDMSPFALHSSPGDGSNARKRKKRVRTWTASDRARHRVFEKGRREAFNERLMELARLLPALSDTKESQLSKHVIVAESFKQHQAQTALIESLRKDLEKVLAEHQQLLAEFNAFRNCLNISSPNAQASTTIASSHLPAVCEQSMALDKLPISYAASGSMFPLEHDRRGTDGGDHSNMAERVATDGPGFQYGHIGPQLASSRDQSFADPNAFITTSSAFEVGQVLDNSTSMDGPQPRGFPPDPQIEIPHGPEYTDVFAFPVYTDDYWVHHQQANAGANYTTGFDGALHSTLISNG